jgi:hypothetical protein
MFRFYFVLDFFNEQRTIMKTTIYRALLPGIVALLSVSVAYGTFKTRYDTTKTEFPVIIYFSIENGRIDPLNLSIEMDGKNVVNRSFSNRSKSPMDSTKSSKSKTYVGSASPPHWGFKLTLAKGTHQIMASTSNGDAGLDVVFTVDKPLWLVLSYWGKNHLQLNISDRPVGFL